MISHVMTLANGIIGVSVLAMPFCFKQCGIILASLVLLLSSVLSRLACHFLIKSAVMSRRRNFEFLAFHAFGPMGKFLVELCIIGFLLGTCIAFFVVVGDLGPQIIGELINKNPEDLRTSFLITTGIFIVLPLGLLRNIDSLASVSTASIAFYICLAVKIIAESTHHIFSTDWINKIHYWRPDGLLQCLPIFALALFCQTQLFEIYEAIPNATLEKMNQVVRGALNICTIVYLCVGFFGYIAFSNQMFTGNILLSFEPSLTSEIIKIGFVLSVAFSFPLVIFPCRASLNSLLFKQGYAHETSNSYISEIRFRSLTTFIVTIALIAGVLTPNIEFVLGIVGSTIGVMICLIFPATFFISISTKNTNERLIAQMIVIIGMWIMILGTYANLYAVEHSSNSRILSTTLKMPSHVNDISHELHGLINNDMLIRADEPKQLANLLNIKEHAGKSELKVPIDPLENENVRQEPPVPVERLSETEVLKNIKEMVVLKPVTPRPKIQDVMNKINNIDSELIKETKIEYDLEKKNAEKDELPVKLEEKLIPIENKKVIDHILKNDAIAVDAINKEELELAADKESKTLNNNEKVNNIKNFSLNSHLNKKPINSIIKKSEDPVIQVLTKQSNKIINENAIANIPKESKKNEVNLENLIFKDKKDIKNKEYIIPIVLKMNNKTKKIIGTENSHINKSNPDFVAARRSILDEHHREKRMIHVEESNISKSVFNKMKNNNSNSNINEDLNKKENVYFNEREELQELDIKKNLNFNDLNNEKTIENLIKSSSYLSDQNVIKKISIHTDMNEGSIFVKLKKRDLKTLNIESDNEK